MQSSVGQVFWSVRGVNLGSIELLNAKQRSVFKSTYLRSILAGLICCRFKSIFSKVIVPGGSGRDGIECWNMFLLLNKLLNCYRGEGRDTHALPPLLYTMCCIVRPLIHHAFPCVGTTHCGQAGGKHYF